MQFDDDDEYDDSYDAFEGKFQIGSGETQDQNIKVVESRVHSKILLNSRKIVMMKSSKKVKKSRKKIFPNKENKKKN